MPNDLLRALPKMDVLLAHPALARAGANLPYSALRQAARDVLDALREDIKARRIDALPERDALALRVAEAARTLCAPHLARVINATGVVLHTNLGRAPLSEAAAQAAYEAARGYCNLEYDVEQGGRGSRHAHIEALLCTLTGAECAMAVNNNAAAVLLMLSALARGRRVAVSRGELVEIGGGFRVPDIMAQSGAALIEVGTTNKTRLADYRHAEPEALLKVHTSNYEIVGFTEETSLAELSTLGLPLLYDLGSGALAPEFFPALPDCPTAKDALSAGADVVCFSADKLLGGPQAGIALGKKECIDAMKRHPLARCVRIDKLSLAALEATLQSFRDPGEALRQIPTLSMLSAAPAELHTRAEALAARCGGTVVAVDSQVGGGAMPAARLPSFAVALEPDNGADALEAALRAHMPPIIARIHQGRVLLDVRTLTGEDMDEIVSALGEAGAR